MLVRLGGDMSTNHLWRIKREAIAALQKIYSVEKQNRLGVYALELKNASTMGDRLRYMKLSRIALSNRKLFGMCAAEVYAATDCIRYDYPHYFEWFWQKAIPGLINGDREVFVCRSNKEVAGLAILKRTDEECKICTLFVANKYRRQGVATRLLELSFGHLGTMKPVITMPESKVATFQRIIDRYGWVETGRKPGLYRPDTTEVFFNA